MFFNMEIAKKDYSKIAIGVAAAGLLTWLIFRNAPDNGQGYGDDPTGNNAGTGSNPVSFDASLAAEKLYEAMRQSGTDESAIMQVFQTVSLGNFAKVYQKFGKRSYNKILGNQYRINIFSELPLHNLSVWLENELSKSSFETLRTKYQSTNLI